ncbi:putative integral membrane protein (TIGR02587 family) [Blastococcus colisei]|uniref:Putative integral membrane protein (TIGR02587 family) n=1 Tax=Blastococcus colisei TaxID=1564162 RepID=A0A543PEW6_9ACTN|nr:DUF2391 family protein [Blastococcus colisei]TQN42624.1 putative integral membrane protein (TIGR02587 family) [Blastococcus colisei]
MQSELLKGMGRALAGALLFAMPVLLTMEIWRLGLSVERYRLITLLVVTVLLVVCLAGELGGAADPTGWRSAAVDGGVAFLVAAFAAAVVLTAVAAVSWRGDWRDALSVVAVETVPAAIGASYARSQLGESSADPASVRPVTSCPDPPLAVATRCRFMSEAVRAGGDAV